MGKEGRSGPTAAQAWECSLSRVPQLQGARLESAQPTQSLKVFKNTQMTHGYILLRNQNIVLEAVKSPPPQPLGCLILLPSTQHRLTY